MLRSTCLGLQLLLLGTKISARCRHQSFSTTVLRRTTRREHAGIYYDNPYTFITTYFDYHDCCPGMKMKTLKSLWWSNGWKSIAHDNTNDWSSRNWQHVVPFLYPFPLKDNPYQIPFSCRLFCLPKHCWKRKFRYFLEKLASFNGRQVINAGNYFPESLK